MRQSVTTLAITRAPAESRSLSAGHTKRPLPDARPTVARGHPPCTSGWWRGPCGIAISERVSLCVLSLPDQPCAVVRGGTSPASWLGRAGAVAGLTIGVLAPVVGVSGVSAPPSGMSVAPAVALTCACS